MPLTETFIFFKPTPEKRKELRYFSNQKFQQEGLKESQEMELQSRQKFSIFTLTVTKPSPEHKVKFVGINFSEPITMKDIIIIIKKGMSELEKENKHKKNPENENTENFEESKKPATNP